MTEKQKRNCLSIVEQIAVIEERETKNTLVRDLSNKYKCSKLQISKILKDKTQIKELWLKYGAKCKRMRRSEKYNDINQIVHLWYQDARSQNLTVSGSILKSCARDVAKYLNKPCFRPSGEWLQRFQREYQIDFGKGFTNPMNINYDNYFCNNFQESPEMFWIEGLTTNCENGSNERQLAEHTISRKEMPISSQLNTPINSPEPIFEAEFNDLFIKSNDLNPECNKLDRCNMADEDSNGVLSAENKYCINDTSSRNINGPIESSSQNMAIKYEEKALSYQDILHYVHAIEDFAISKNDITLLKLSTVTRYFIEKKVTGEKALGCQN